MINSKTRLATSISRLCVMSSAVGRVDISLQQHIRTFKTPPKLGNPQKDMVNTWIGWGGVLRFLVMTRRVSQEVRVCGIQVRCFKTNITPPLCGQTQIEVSIIVHCFNGVHIFTLKSTYNQSFTTPPKLGTHEKSCKIHELGREEFKGYPLWPEEYNNKLHFEAYKSGVVTRQFKNPSCDQTKRKWPLLPTLHNSAKVVSGTIPCSSVIVRCVEPKGVAKFYFFLDARLATSNIKYTESDIFIWSFQDSFAKFVPQLF